MQGQFMTWLIAAVFGALGGWLAGLFGVSETEATPATVVAVVEIGEVATSPAELVCDGSTDSRIEWAIGVHEDEPSGRGVPARGLNTFWPGVC